VLIDHAAAGGKAEEKHEQRHGGNRICHVLSTPAHLTPNAAINSPALPESDAQSTESIKIGNTVVASLPA